MTAVSYDPLLKFWQQSTVNCHLRTVTVPRFISILPHLLQKVHIVFLPFIGINLFHFVAKILQIKTTTMKTSNWTWGWQLQLINQAIAMASCKKVLIIIVSKIPATAPYQMPGNICKSIRRYFHQCACVIRHILERSLNTKPNGNRLVVVKLIGMQYRLLYNTANFPLNF